MYFLTNRLAKYLVILILAASFIFGLWWLWQRQPKPKFSQETQIANLDNKPTEGSPISPPDLTVQTTQKVSFKGKTKVNSLIVFYSNNFATVTKSDNDGNFASSEVTFEKGFNQVNMAVILDNLAQNTTFNYLLADDTKDGDIIYAGPVKKILDTLITISLNLDEKNVRTLNSVFTFSQDLNSEEAALSPIKRIRIEDFIIAQGFLPQDKNDNQLKAKRIEVFRQNPVNTRSLAIAKIIAGPKQNKLQAKVTSDNSLLELTASKETRIQMDKETVQLKDVKKDKNAILVYHLEEDKKLIDLIYLLP